MSTTTDQLSRPLAADRLPLPTKRGLSREEAAAYVGVSTGSFDRLVAAGALPGPVPLGIDLRRRVWDRIALDRAFDDRSGVSAREEKDWLAEYR